MSKIELVETFRNAGSVMAVHKIKINEEIKYFIKSDQYFLLVTENGVEETTNEIKEDILKLINEKKQNAKNKNRSGCNGRKW